MLVYVSGAPPKEQCTTSKAGRRIITSGHEALRMKMAQKMRSEVGREKYKLRAQTVEAPLGDIKQNQGMREFLTKGVESVKTEFNLACTRLGATFNLGGFNFKSTFTL